MVLREALFSRYRDDPIIRRGWPMGGLSGWDQIRKKKNGAKKYQKMPTIYFRAFGPKIRGVQKLPQKVVFWLKKCENFRIRHPVCFFSKSFHPTNATEKELCAKRHFFNRNSTWKKKYIAKKSQNFRNFSVDKQWKYPGRGVWRSRAGGSPKNTR